MLLLIFIAAFTIRFLYFPNDINFTYDQARDAFVSFEVASGDIKIIGPPAAFEGVYHGPLFYYLVAPIYFFTSGSPEVVSAFLRICNALSIFLVYLLASTLFNKRAGLFSALLFAFSFEQSQYAIFLGHPAAAVPTVLLFYLGLALLFFKRDKRGLILSFIGVGLSIQFHFSLVALFLPLLLLFIFLKNSAPTIDRRTVFYSLLVFFLAVATFVVAELKFGFRTINTGASFLGGSGGASSFNFRNVVLVAQRYVSDNIFSYRFEYLVLTILLIALFYMIRNKKLKAQGIFLAVWLLGGLFLYLFDKTAVPTYYYGIAGSASLIILASFLLDRIYVKWRVIGIALVLIILFSNIQRISKTNPSGVIPEIITQDKLLLVNQKQAIDYIYKDSEGSDFSVSALTNPYSVNTTWAYLF